MTRPFAVIGFSLFAALLIAAFLSSAAALLVGIGLLLLLVLLLFWKGQRAVSTHLVTSVALLSAALAFLLYGGHSYLRVQPYEQLDGETCQIKGTLTANAVRDHGRYYYTVKVTELGQNGAPLSLRPFQTYLSSAKPLVAERYDEIETEVTFFAHQQAYGLSSKSSWLSKGIPIRGYMSGYDSNVLPATDKPISGAVHTLRERLLKGIRVALPEEEASVTEAMVLGERHGLSAEISDWFRGSGVSHLLVVSGLHMSIVSGMILALLTLLRLGRRLRLCCAMAAVLLFMAVAGFTASVLRSGVMLLVWLLGRLIGRAADPLNSLGFAVALICATNPFIGGDSGFLMSVLATLGILLFSEKLTAVLLRPFATPGKWLKAVASGLSTGICATVFVLPVQVYLFGTVNLLSPVVTLLLSVPVTLLLYAGVIGALLSLAGGLAALAPPFFLLAGICAKGMLRVTKWLSSLPGTSLSLAGDFGILVLAAALLLVAVSMLIGVKRRMVWLPVLLGVLVAASGVCAKHWQLHEGTTVLVADAGAESCVVVIQDRKAVVCGLAGYRTDRVKRLLTQYGVQEVEALFLWQPGTSVLEATGQVLAAFPVKTVYVDDGLMLPRQVEQRVLTGANRVSLPTELKLTVWEETTLHWTEVSGFFMTLPEGQRIGIVPEGAPAPACDLLVTASPGERPSAKLTILQAENDEGLTGVPPGRYLLAGDEMTIAAGLEAGEVIKVRRVD